MKNLYQIVVCDDEEQILKDIYAKTKAAFLEQEIKAEFFCTKDSRILMDFLQEKFVDVIFLDIDMPYFSGMDIAAYLNEKCPNTLLVFVTSQDALVYQTFAYRPFAFLRKTYFEEELPELIVRIKKEWNKCQSDIVINKGREVIRILIKDILYIESEGNYLNIYTSDNIIKVRETMTAMEKELIEKGFIRCHKGYLVNMEHMEELKGQEMILALEGIRKTIPVGRSYEKDVRRSILERMRN